MYKDEQTRKAYREFKQVKELNNQKERTDSLNDSPLNIDR